MARKIRAILWIGLVAGTLDITENLVFNHFRGISAWRVFQYIASGLIGMKSFQSGWNSVALGVAIHLRDRPDLDGNISLRRTEVSHDHPAPGSLRRDLWLPGLSHHDPYGAAAFRSSASAGRDHHRTKNQRRVGSHFLYWIAHFASHAKS
jgi:hypothetical protein